MAEPSTFQKILRSIVNFFRGLVDRLKKADKRFLIMIAAAVVILILIICLVAHGVKSKKATDTTTESYPQIVAEDTTEDVVSNSLQTSSKGTNSTAGTYVVDTGSETPLNMRLAADKNSQVLTTITNGTSLTVLYVDTHSVAASGDYGWGYVEYHDQYGWVYMENLKTSK